MMTVVDQARPWLMHEEDIGGDDPPPGRREIEEERNRDAEEPSRHEYALPANAVTETACEEIRGSIYETETDNEGENSERTAVLNSRFWYLVQQIAPPRSAVAIRCHRLARRG